MQSELILVIPVYNDWPSVQRLLSEAETLLKDRYKLKFVLINDSSSLEPDISFFETLQYPTVVLELSRNMGHQVAIAAGLAYSSQHLVARYVVVMDADGEDRPKDILSLLAKAATFEGVIFAKRTKRSEGLVFRLYYRLYKFLFTLLTGKHISFGNFCIFPFLFLKKIVHVPDIWNHFSGGIIRSGIPYMALATKRGMRYHGVSKMNFTRLILHGLSAVAVYADVMAVRLILLSFLLIVTTLVGIGVVAFVRVFTHLAIPGWATFTVLGLVILLFLALFLGLFLLFNVLNMKTQQNIIPARDYQDYIIDVKIIDPHG